MPLDLVCFREIKLPDLSSGLPSLSLPSGSPLMSVRTVPTGA
jgi:hypothetical protein